MNFKISAQSNRNVPASISKQQGLSLVEVMVAVTLSLILAAGVGQIYLANKQSYRLQDAQGRIQENGRYALEVIARDLRQAGNRGCAPRTVNANVVAKAPPGDTGSTPAFTYSMTAATGIVGYDSTPSNSSPAWLTNDAATPTNYVLGSNHIPSVLTNVILGTDIITMQYGEACGGRLAYPVNCNASSTAPCTGATSGPFLLVSTNVCNAKCASSTSCDTGDNVYLISNCANVDMFRASSISSAGAIEHGTLMNTNANFGVIYDTTAELMNLRVYSYYLRLGESGEPSLFRYDHTTPAGGNNPVELVEGVEDMQILYGVDTDTTADSAANRYVMAASVTDWSRVASVRITLKLRSLDLRSSTETTLGADNLISAPRTYSFNGASVTDKRFTREFSTTIDLRNDL